MPPRGAKGHRPVFHAVSSPSAAVTGVAGPPKPALKPIDVFDLEWVADPQISPDGRRIAYVRMSMDLKTDQPRGVIWLVDGEGKNARPLSSADSSSHPRWSPDGTRIAYLGTGGDGSHQLFMYWVDSNVTSAISHFMESPSSVAWSPDGRSLGIHDAGPRGAQAAESRLAGAAEGRQVGGPSQADRSIGLSRRRRGLPAQQLQSIVRHRGKWRSRRGS